MNTDQFIIAINLDKKFNMMNPSAVHSDSKSLKKGLWQHISGSGLCHLWPLDLIVINIATLDD